jgi:hypothetical protein
MNLKIFYSWQTSTDRDKNLNLIADAITKSVEKLKRKHPGRFDSLIIDRDTEGKPGMPAIPETLEEKIKDCDIFICDFTVESQKPPSFFQKLFAPRGSNLRPGPNRNVMMEFGAAKAELSNERLIGILNAEYGNPHDDPSLMPFDMRHQKFPIIYSTAIWNKSEKEKQTENLAEKIYLELNQIIKHSLSKKWDKYGPFINWPTAVKFEGETFNLVETGETTRVISAIHEAAQVKRSVTRILGLSGLGKTRLILEAFRPVEDDQESISRSERLLYFDRSISDESVVSKVTEMALSNETITLVVDNCEKETHRILAKLVTNEESRLSLITVFTDPAEYIAEGTSVIILDPEKFIDLVDEFVDRLNPDLSEENRAMIKRYAHGFPLVAHILAKNRRKNPEVMGPIGNKWIVDKLLGVEGEDSNNRKALRALSLFSKIGYDDEVEKQLVAISTNAKITYLNLDDRHSEMLFRKICKLFHSRRIFEIRGRFLIMRPIMLSISLAEEWWDECLESDIPELLVDLEKIGLTEAFCQQWKYLSYHTRAIEITNKLTGANGPFAKAEVLNTEPGSLLFRYIVEVNPESSAIAALTAFQSLPIDAIIKLTPGRRNLVWALEKLCWHSRVFETSAKTLLMLAAGENELHISNNATASFLQLFQVGIPPTQANLSQRSALLSFCTEHENKIIRELGIAALARSLQGQGFTRWGGPEEQGGRLPMESYQPEYSEILSYWSNSISVLGKIADRGGQESMRARNALLDRFREVSMMRAFHLIFPVLQRLNEKEPYDPPLLLEKLETTLHLNSRDLTELERDQLVTFVNEIKTSSNSFKDRYRIIVARPSYRIPGKKAQDISQEVRFLVKDFANETIYKKVDLTTKFDLIFDLDQREHWYYGNCIAAKQIDLGNNLSEIALPALDYICELQNQEVNLGFLLGYFSRIENQVDADLISDHLTTFDCLFKFTSRLIAAIPKEFEAYLKLFPLIEEGKMEVEDLLEFKYKFNDSPVDKILEFCNYLSIHELRGAVISIEILFSYSYSDSEKWDEVKGAIKSLIVTQKGILNSYRVRRSDSFSMFESVRQLLEETKDDEFALEIISQIIEKLNLPGYHATADVALSNLTITLIENYFSVIWPSIGEALIREDPDFLFYLNLKSLLGAHLSDFSQSEGTLFRGDQELIFHWAKENRPNGAIRLASLVPTIWKPENDDSVCIHPFTSRMIDEFGENEDLLQEISSQFHSFSWSGSLVPLLSTQKAIFITLKTHKFQAVRIWAEKEISQLEARIRNETNFDEERLL